MRRRGPLSAPRHHHGMGHRGRACRAGCRGRAGYRAGGRAVPVRQARISQWSFRGVGPAEVSAMPARAADYARLTAVPAIWGGTFVGGKFVVAALSPLMGSFARYVIACAALLVAAFALEGGLPRLTRAQVAGTFLLGLLGVFAYNLFFMGALERLPASRAALIIALNPVITIAISAVALGDQLRARRWVGVAVALAGVWI